jgi:acetylglutamate kinase
VAADLGLVGEPTQIRAEVINDLLMVGAIPVIAPIGSGIEDGKSYNINADTAAGAIAGALGAARLLLLTDVVGVLDANKRLLPTLATADVARLVADGTISGGMIPKLETATDAVDAGVRASVRARARAAARLRARLCVVRRRERRVRRVRARAAAPRFDSRLGRAVSAHSLARSLARSAVRVCASAAAARRR